MGYYQPTSKLLWTLAGSGEPTTITASGDSTTGAGPTTTIDLRETTDLALIVAVASVSGTTPTLMVQVDMQDANGVWVPGVVKLAANITAAGTFTAYGGLHATSSGYVVLTGKARVAWTVGGTASPTFTGTTVALYGR